MVSAIQSAASGNPIPPKYDETAVHAIRAWLFYYSGQENAPEIMQPCGTGESALNRLRAFAAVPGRQAGDG